MKLHFTYFLAVAILVTFNNNTFSMQATQKQSRWSLASIAEFFGYYRSRPEDVTVMHSLSKMYTTMENGSKMYAVDPNNGTIYVAKKVQKLKYDTQLVPATDSHEQYAFVSLDGNSTPLKQIPDTNKIIAEKKYVEIYTTNTIPDGACQCDSTTSNTILFIGKKLNEEALAHKRIMWNLTAPKKGLSCGFKNYEVGDLALNPNNVVAFCEIDLKNSQLYAHYEQSSDHAPHNLYVAREAI